MTKEKILAEINAYMKNTMELYRLTTVVENLKEDIRIETAKKTTPTKKINLIKAILKSASQFSNRDFSKGYFWGCNKYCFTDSFRIYYLNNDFGYEKVNTELAFEKFLSDGYDKTIELDLTELKTFVKVCKAEGNNKPILTVDSVSFNAQYLAEAIEIIGSSKLQVKDGVKNCLGKFENENGEIALVCQVLNR